MTRRPRIRRRDVIAIALLGAGLAAGLLLVVFGGADEPAGRGADGDADAPTGTLPLDDVTAAGIERWSGLDLPAETSDLLTARVGEAQLDLTFTMAPEDEAAFVEGSGLPELQPGRRYVLHSSPLWRLNPGGDTSTASSTAPGAPSDSGSTVAPERPEPDGSTAPEGSTAPAPVVRGAADVHDGVARAVELVEESGRVRARIVLTPAA